MFFKKTVCISIVALCSISTLFAYDTQGKFGMGIRMWGTPVILFSSMKYGITNAVGLEPSIGFDRMKVVSEYEVGPDSMAEYSNTLSLFNISGMLDLKPVRAAKSNLVIRLGLDYIRGSVSAEDEGDPQADYDDNLWKLGFAGGMGIEHFFTDQFSVYAGFLNAINLFGTKEESFKSLSFSNFGNQFAELTFVWYLR